MFDPKCFALAESFAEPHHTQEQIVELAQAIQDAIEMYLEPAAQVAAELAAAINRYLAHDCEPGNCTPECEAEQAEFSPAEVQAIKADIEREEVQ